MRQASIGLLGLLAAEESSSRTAAFRIEADGTLRRVQAQMQSQAVQHRLDWSGVSAGPLDRFRPIAGSRVTCHADRMHDEVSVLLSPDPRGPTGELLREYSNTGVALRMLGAEMALMWRPDGTLAVDERALDHLIVIGGVA